MYDPSKIENIFRDIATSENSSVSDCRSEIVYAVSMMVADNVIPVPVFPEYALKLVNMVDTGEFSFRSISRIIVTNDMLTAKVISEANSAFYNHSAEPVSSVEDAVRRIGLEEVRAILFATVLSSFYLNKDSYPEVFEEFWTHSLATAFAAEFLAEKTNNDPAKSFTTGLLLNVGRTVALSALLHVKESLNIECKIETEIVREISVDIGNIIGKHIADKWGFPKNIVRSISEFAKPLSDVITDYETIRYKYASDLASLCGFGNGLVFEDSDEDIYFMLLNINLDSAMILKSQYARECYSFLQRYVTTTMGS